MLKNNFNTAWRNLKRNKVYSFINIGGIAIGLAAFWLITMYVGDELSYDRSFTNSNNIYRIAQHAAWKGGKFDLPLTPPPLGPALTQTFPEVQASVRIDAEGGGIIKYRNTVIKENDIFFADKKFFQVFDYPFISGDAATALAKPNSIVITESLAKKIFGDPATALNQSVSFGDSEPQEVTGIIKDVPKNSHLQFSGIRSMYVVPNDQNTWQNLYMYNYLLLKKSADVKDFEKKLDAFGKEKIAKIMDIPDYRMELQPLPSIHLHSDLQYELGRNSNIRRVYIFIAIAVLILLIALINYVNLATARAAMRVKEIGIRKVIGSSRAHLTGLFICEAVLVTFIAAFLAGIIVNFSISFFNQVAGKNLDIWRFGLVNTIAFVAVLALVAGLVSGGYPALLFSRFKMIPSLKGQLGNMHNNAVLQKSLVVFQFVIAVFLISSSFIIYRQLQFVNSKDLGFNKNQVVTFHIDDMKVRNEIPALKSALLQNTAIEDVAVASNALGDSYLGGHDFTFEKDSSMQSSPVMARQLYIDEDFLKTMDIHLLQGRNFSKDMSTDQVSAILINETLMKQLDYKDAIGKRAEFKVNQLMDRSHRTIVGVVKDFHNSSLQHKIEPLVLMLPPAVGEQDNLYVKIKQGRISEALQFLKSTYAKFDKQNAANFVFLDEAFAKQYEAEKNQEKLSFVFTMLSFIIACLGLTGLVMFTVSQRVKEIGIRKVLGASFASLIMMLAKNFMQLVVVATVIAIPIAWFAMNKWLQDFAYRITITWWMLLIPCMMAICIAVITVFAQAMKAAMANPVKSLRSE